MTFQEVSKLLLANHPTQPVCSTIASLDHSYGSMTMAMTLSAYGPISILERPQGKKTWTLANMVMASAPLIAGQNLINETTKA